jgi:hypothetical protein
MRLQMHRVTGKDHSKGEIYMEPNQNTNTHNGAHWTSVGNIIHEIFQEGHARRVVIRRRFGEKVFDCSVILALILSVGAPILPGLVILGMWVEVIRVSIEKV